MEIILILQNGFTIFKETELIKRFCDLADKDVLK